MVEQGVVDDVDYFVGAHIGLNAKSNEIITSVKGFLASTKLDVQINGVSSHAGAQPQDGRNALLLQQHSFNKYMQSNVMKRCISCKCWYTSSR